MWLLGRVGRKNILCFESWHAAFGFYLLTTHTTASWRKKYMSQHISKAKCSLELMPEKKTQRPLFAKETEVWRHSRVNRHHRITVKDVHSIELSVKQRFSACTNINWSKWFISVNFQVIHLWPTRFLLFMLCWGISVNVLIN